MPPPPERIPFNRPFVAGRELFYIAQAVVAGNLGGDGVFTRRCADWMETNLGAQKVLLTHSCTAALEMGAILANLEPGDEVVLPSYTFVTTASAFALRGARLRFVDIREDTLNIDEKQIEAAITRRTKVIVPVHYAGVGAEMDEIMTIADRHGLLVVEDAAQGVCAQYKKKSLGTIGHLGAFSFHETKNLISGEGGALAVNRPDLCDRAQIVRDKGTDRFRFDRGEVDKYTWVDLGSSYLASELVAAFLAAQFEVADLIKDKRRATFERYHSGLEHLEKRGVLRRPRWPAHCDHNGHMFYILLESRSRRDQVIEHLDARNIQAVFHYVPLHSSPMGKDLGYTEGALPVTESVADRLLRLPCYFELTPSDQGRVVDALESFFA